jgi:hypothetical protein
VKAASRISVVDNEDRNGKSIRAFFRVLNQRSAKNPPNGPPTMARSMIVAAGGVRERVCPFDLAGTLIS